MIRHTTYTDAAAAEVAAAAAVARAVATATCVFLASDKDALLYKLQAAGFQSLKGRYSARPKDTLLLTILPIVDA